MPLWQSAIRSPAAAALDDGDSRWTYAELAALADTAADHLASAGASSGDRVVVLSSPSVATVALVHAAMRLGAVLCPLNTRLTAGEIESQIGRLDARLIVADRAHQDLGRVGRERGVALEAMCPLSEAATRQPSAGATHGELIGAFVPADAPQAILFSSGTTDAPKGVVLTVGNFLASAIASAMRLGVQPGDEWLVALPLYHVGGLSIVTRSAVYGTCVRLMQGFDATAALDLLTGGALSHMSLVPTMLHRLLKSWDEAGRPALHPRVRVLLLGGAPADPSLLTTAKRAGWPIVQTYGLTEATSQVATEMPPSSRLEEPSVSSGDAIPRALPLPYVDVRVVDDNGEAVPAGEPGEIRVRGPVVMAGYWRDPEATAAALAAGWLHTGDVGRLHADGTLTVDDRRDDLIITGGENVSPREVEAVLLSHPAVGACCVVGEPDPEWGATVVAVIVPRQGRRETTEPDLPGMDERQWSRRSLEAELLAHAAASLARYKQPRRILWADTLPLTAGGKVRRGVVREWVNAGADGKPSSWIPASALPREESATENTEVTEAERRD